LLKFTYWSIANFATIVNPVMQSFYYQIPSGSPISLNIFQALSMGRLVVGSLKIAWNAKSLL